MDVYAFFLRGSDILKVADISRISRDETELKGFQRKEIRSHVNSIVEFLDSGPVLFPNAIILALSDKIEFKFSRGQRPDGMVEVADSGNLTIPIRPENERAAWVVDGQQRSLALARASNSEIAVPVVGFVSSDLETQRAQFILVNKARPLPHRLIDELLPEVSTIMPRDLDVNRLPSELCNQLNRQSRSPFYKLVRRSSSRSDEPGVVADSALVAAIRQNLKPPLGALSQYEKNGTSCDAEAIFNALVLYWTSVKEAFSDAWGKPPAESRLMHSVGIRTMGAVMDPIMVRADSSADPKRAIKEALLRLAPHCCWTEGTWPELGWRWNEVQSTTQNIVRLRNHLIQLDRTLSRKAAAR